MDFEAELTMIIDDHAVRFNDDTPITAIAVTALVKIKNRGETHLVAQTYQNLYDEELDELLEYLSQGPCVNDSCYWEGDGITEQKLKGAVATSHILQDFLFEEGDNALAQQLRAALGVTGTPVIVAQPDSLTGHEYEDHTADGTGSIIRARVTIRFYQP
jgi:hypothetical protein